MLLRFLLLCLVLPASARAAVDPVLFQDLHWRLIGPFRGGRVLAVSGVPGEPEHFYFGSVNGGVWETDDAGRTWRPLRQEIGRGCRRPALEAGSPLRRDRRSRYEVRHSPGRRRLQVARRWQ